MKLGQAGLAIIKHYEQGPGGGPALESYVCPAGVWTIGWGHTNGVRFGQHCTLAQAEQWLVDDYSHAQKAVNEAVSVALTQNQFDALVSFAFNVGVGAFLGSTLLKFLNSGNYGDAASQFKRWVKSKGVTLNGLVKRRDEERSLFLTGLGA